MRELGAQRNEQRNEQQRREREREAEKAERCGREALSDRDGGDSGDDSPAQLRSRHADHGGGIYGGGWDGREGCAIGSSQQEPEAELAQLERIRLTRSTLEKWVVEPFFEDAVVGAFVRIGIGRRDDQPMYRVAEVVGVKDGFRLYKMGEYSTGKRLVLRVGDAEKPFQMSFVSNQNFEPSELAKYERAIKETSYAGKKKSEIDQKVEQLKRCKKHNYTADEVKAMVEEQTRSRLLQRGNMASRKLKLQNLLSAAEEAQDEKSKRQLQEDMNKLRDKAETAKKIEERRESISFRIKDINMRNQEFERKVTEEARARQRRQASGQDEAKPHDPFARIEGGRTMYWTVKKTDDTADMAAVATLAPAKNGTELTVVVDEKMGPMSLETNSRTFKEFVAMPCVNGVQLTEAQESHAQEVEAASDRDAGQKGKMPSKIIGKRAEAHAVELDINIEAPELWPVPRPRAAAASASPHVRSGSNPARTTLSVTDYKRRMGIL